MGFADHVDGARRARTAQWTSARTLRLRGGLSPGGAVVAWLKVFNVEGYHPEKQHTLDK
jgi:hypothetical protein